VRASAEFLSPARMDDVLEVRARVARVGRSSFGLRHEILRLETDGQYTPIATGSEERVFTAQAVDGMHSQQLTPHMREVLARFYDGSGTAEADGLQHS